MRIKMTCHGNPREPLVGSFQLLFQLQQAFQKKVTGIDTPVDDPKWFQYHMTAMTEELGEVLKADKRWKTHRNAFHDQGNKEEELADVFVTAINLAIYSGCDAEKIYNAISAKIAANTEKWEALQHDSNS